MKFKQGSYIRHKNPEITGLFKIIRITNRVIWICQVSDDGTKGKESWFYDFALANYRYVPFKEVMLWEL